MTKLLEIEAAITRLPHDQVEQLASWLHDHLKKGQPNADFDGWLNRARGAALPGARTDEILAESRGEN